MHKPSQHTRMKETIKTLSSFKNATPHYTLSTISLKKTLLKPFQEFLFVLKQISSLLYMEGLT